MGLLTDIILELSVKKKDRYASGDEHNIYKSVKDPTKLFKISKGPNEDTNKWVELFKNNPKLFPTVYRVFDNGAEVEKLNIVKAQKEYDNLRKTFKEGPVRFTWLLMRIYDKDKVKEDIESNVEHLKETDPALVKPFLDWCKLISEISKIDLHKDLDIHGGNFGYDKQGHLKMLDV